MLNQQHNSHYLSDGKIQKNPWALINHSSAQMTRLQEQTALPVIESNEVSCNILVPLENWINFASILNHATRPLVGLIVDGFEEIETLTSVIDDSGLTPDAIFIDFPVFSDGRGYSLAQLLLRLQTSKENIQLPIGAIGDILQDQIFFYWRCGFQLIIPRTDQNLELCSASLQSFSHAYQPAHCQP